MIHARQSARPGRAAQARTRLLVGAVVAALLAAGCGENGAIDPGDSHYGRQGRIEATIETPLRLGDGRLTETLSWRSNGEWSLLEVISYRGIEGDRTTRRNRGDQANLVLSYLSVIEQLNDVEALSLFVEDSLPPDLIPECDATQSRITVTIVDEARSDSTTWIRCAFGSLSNLTPEGAGPGSWASRLVQATLLVREATLGVAWSSTYLGSVPFGTLDRGGDSGSPLTAPVTFIDAGGFSSFWSRHAPGRAPPTVDFTRDMVVVGIVGTRREAGDSVEVRRVLRVEEGSVTEVFERVPGDFCSPAARTHVPFHIVVAPRTPIPHRFADIRVERVPCGV